MAEGIGFLIGMIIVGVLGFVASMLMIWLYGKGW